MSSHTTSGPLAAAAGSITIGDDLTVNRMGFGAMRLTGRGIWGPPADRPEAIRVLRRAIELGVDFIDTADSYGPEVSEEIIAEALHPYPEGLVIATKGGLERPGPDKWVTNGRPEYLRRQLKSSLRRLKVERIDLWQLHRIDEKVPEDEQFDVIAGVPAGRPGAPPRALRGDCRPDRAGAAGRSDRFGTEPLQPHGPGVGGRSRLQRARGPRIPALVPPGRRRRWTRAARWRVWPGGTGRRPTRSRSPGCSPTRRPCW